MNNPPNQKPKLAIKAQSIGPIMSLDHELSENKQNLIFARNGTGKSFIARALRLLNNGALPEMATSSVPDLLVSEESDGKGSFGLYEGNNCIGKFELDTKHNSVKFSEPQYIFTSFQKTMWMRISETNSRNWMETLPMK